MYIQMLLQYQEHLAKLDDQIDALAGEIEEYRLSSRSLVSEKRSRQRLFLKLERSNGLITLKNLLPSLGLIQVYIRRENLRRRLIE
jgi:hypothetical protein